MEIHFQTTDHVVAVEKVAEQHIRTKYSNLRVISHLIILGKSAITHSKVGQSSPNPQCSSFRENCVTHAGTHMVQIIISRRRAGQEIMKLYKDQELTMSVM